MNDWGKNTSEKTARLQSEKTLLKFFSQDPLGGLFAFFM